MPDADGAPPAGWHALDIEAVRRRLACGAGGLTSAEAARRLRRHGPNRLPEPPRRGLGRIVLAQIASPLILLLLAAAAVAAALGDLKDAAFIALVLVINTAIGTAQEARAEASAAALKRAIQASVRARRDGAVRRIDSAELVPGDTVLVEAGERVPADLRLVSGVELQADEASLTGESLPVDKRAGAVTPEGTALGDRLGMLHAGTTLRRGHGEGLVVATGRDTEIGRIAQALAEPATQPPLMRRLDRFSRVLGLITLGLVGLMMAIQVAAGTPLRETFFVAVALAVSVIPEGLPVAVTVALSIASRRMARRHVIVRQLPAVEGLGACTVVATDKTGTLTLNRLTARRVWLPGLGEVARDGAAPPGEGLAALERSAVLCNDATVDPSLGAAGMSGDSVDIALLERARADGLDPAALRTACPRLAEIPFAAERRYAASLNRDGDGLRLHVKGAAEALAPLCRGPDAADILAAAERMAAQGYKVLAIATRPVSGQAHAHAAALESELSDLTLLGLVGFIDPLRPEAKEAVAACRRAGVAVKMVTGDHAATALAIARDLGIAGEEGRAVTGGHLRAAAGDPAAQARLAEAAVFARVEPAQKVEIVELLQAAGHVVAMTGDGVNDAPALKRADLGVAMGRGGTDVARDAADLVLTDDNFASVVAGIEEGRAAYANIRKVIYLLISTGAAEVMLFLLAVATGLPVPLTAVQLLWLNLVTNGGQDVALAFERREAGMLDRPPRRPDEPIFDRLMLRETAVSGLYTGAVAYAVFALALSQGWSEEAARTGLLFLMVLFENVHVFNCRSETLSAFRVPLRHNRWLIVAVVAAQSLHIAAAYIPGLREVLQIEPISPGLWLGLAALALSILPMMELDKALRARAQRRGRSAAGPEPR
ncbi:MULTISPECIES: cation-translocating P-type ATPase [unclassified Methylobacterium]|uniref:cation-translocating P-type ATPase n=1 Tax=unclassified Methylobacterium TaxID=2615210 RepID=UPI0036F618AD